MIRTASSAGLTGLLLAAALPIGAQQMPQPSPAPNATETPVTGPAYGANDPCTSLAAIVSRPSQTTSVCTVRSRHVLVETGYANTSADATSTTVQYPQATVRIGLAVPALELDLGVPTVARLTAAGTTATGTTDIGAGLKYVLGYSPRFNYGLSAFFTAPTGTNGFSSGGSGRTLNLNYGYTVNPVLSLAGTVGYNDLAQSGRHYTSVIPSLVLTAALPNLTGLFVEAAQFTNAIGPATPTRTQFIGGITRGLSPRAQIDLEVGRSATTGTGKYRFIGFGASYYL